MSKAYLARKIFRVAVPQWSSWVRRSYEFHRNIPMFLVYFRSILEKVVVFVEPNLGPIFSGWGYATWVRDGSISDSKNVYLWIKTFHTQSRSIFRSGGFLFRIYILWIGPFFDFVLCQSDPVLSQIQSTCIFRVVMFSLLNPIPPYYFGGVNSQLLGFGYPRNPILPGKDWICRLTFLKLEIFEPTTGGQV